MDSTKTFLLLLAVVGCLIVPTTNAALLRPPRTPQSRVYSICKTAQNQLLCYKTLLPQALTGKFNLYKALNIEVQATKVQVEKTITLIGGLLAKPGTSRSVADSLTVCKEQYGNVMDAIKETVTVLAKRDVTEAKFKFGAVMSYHQACNEQFDGETSPIAIDAQAVYDFGGNSLDIIAMIEKRESRRRGSVPAPVVTVPVVADPCKGVIGICG